MRQLGDREKKEGGSRELPSLGFCRSHQEGRWNSGGMLEISSGGRGRDFQKMGGLNVMDEAMRLRCREGCWRQGGRKLAATTKDLNEEMRRGECVSLLLIGGNLISI